MMKVTVLGSGSKGNSTLVEVNDKKILLDVGFSYKKIKDRLYSIGLYPNDIDYIFISHDHSDHIAGLKVFLNKHNPKVYISEKIAKINDYLKFYPYLNYLDGDIVFPDFRVLIIPTSHDATDSKGFIIEADESVVYLTDTGYVNSRNFMFLKNREYYIFESNHDIDMLVKGKYPFYLQQRINSDVGHLSNTSSAMYLSKLIGDKTKKIVLAHLSEEHNTEDLALNTFKEVMKEYDINFDNVVCAKQDELVSVSD